MISTADAAFLRGLADYRHEVAVGRIRCALGHRVERAPDFGGWLLGFLAPWRPAVRFTRFKNPMPGSELPYLGAWDVHIKYDVPFGWVAVRETNRNAVRIMPCWVAWPYLAWTCRWWLLEPLVRAGVLTLQDGYTWHSARPWFWNAEREASFREIFNVGRE